MSSGETSLGTDLRTAARRIWPLYAVALLALAGVLLYSFVWRGAPKAPGPPKAVIVDQLSLTAPNPDFAEQATALLERAGYTVDYVPGGEVTVDFYRDLPTHGYDLVLLRAHAAGVTEVADETFAVAKDATLFTSERLSQGRHARELSERRVRLVVYERGERKNVFYAIPPEFVESSMKGNFEGATVVLMGCDVLRGEGLAEAFVERGAGAVVGWDGPVLASHTDAATLSMLRQMLDEYLPVNGATAAAMREVGPDPVHGSLLLSYPPEG